MSDAFVGSKVPEREGTQQVVHHNTGEHNCTMYGVGVQALEDQAQRTDHAASSISVQQLNIQEKLIQAEACGPKVRARLRKGNPSEAELDVKAQATQLTFPNRSTCRVEGNVSGQLNMFCSSDRDVPETQMDHFFSTAGIPTA